MAPKKRTKARFPMEKPPTQMTDTELGAAIEKTSKKLAAYLAERVKRIRR